MKRQGDHLSRQAGLAAVAYAFAATMLGTTLPTPLYSIYQRRFGFSELIVTVIFATYAAGVIAALLLLGRVSDEAGRRPVLLLGLGLSALSAVIFLVANGLAPLLVGRLVSGFSAGIFTGTATVTLVDLAADRQHRQPGEFQRGADKSGPHAPAFLGRVFALSEWWCSGRLPRLPSASSCSRSCPIGLRWPSVAAG